MREHTVRECGLNGAANDFGRHNGGDFFSAIGAGKFQRSAARGEPGAGNHRGERIQNVLLGFLDCLLGQRARTGSAHVGAELLHDGADGVRRPAGTQKRGSLGESG